MTLRKTNVCSDGERDVRSVAYARYLLTSDYTGTVVEQHEHIISSMYCTYSVNSTNDICAITKTLNLIVHAGI